MNVKNFFQSRAFKIAVSAIGGLLILLLVFKAGMLVGYRKAGFSFKYGDNYFKNFGGRMEKNRMMRGFGDKDFMMRGFGDMDFMRAGGASGQILKIDSLAKTEEVSATALTSLPQTGSNGVAALIIKDRDGTEKIILVTDKTEIRKFRETVKLSDLKIDDYVVVIGEPNDAGQVEAKLIRIMPGK